MQQSHLIGSKIGGYQRLCCLFYGPRDDFSRRYTLELYVQIPDLCICKSHGFELLFTPTDLVPDAFMEKVQQHFGEQFHHPYGEGHPDLSRYDPGDQNGIERTDQSPADRFGNASQGPFRFSIDFILFLATLFI
jgi:hypothetical protein